MTVELKNNSSIPLSDIPIDDMSEWRKTIIQQVDDGSRISALFATPPKSPNAPHRLYAVLAHDKAGTLTVVSSETEHSYPCLTQAVPQAHWFEREIYEQWEIKPEGHPWLKPIRFQSSYHHAKNNDSEHVCTVKLPGVTDYFQVEGSEIHEVAVGPVHAGVIEPGHFRFQCHGEEVLHLEISLGYQHRGIEKSLVGGPNKRTAHIMEILAGDTSVAHQTAYAQIIETLSQSQVSPKAQWIRALGLELERLANHTGDLGALANDVAYLPTASFCGRLRGDFLNLTLELCGNRLGRGLVRPGGVQFDADAPMIQSLCEKLKAMRNEVGDAAGLLFETPSVLARFENVGIVTQSAAQDLGLVGPAARASGINIDCRRDFPFGLYREKPMRVQVGSKGDVFARARIRSLEIDESIQFILNHSTSLPEGNNMNSVGSLISHSLVPHSLAISMVEGWRGEICHVALTDNNGKFAHYKIIDPSFHNWFGLAFSLRNQQISDFPLCNKSFNLSYCGHDL